MTFNIYVRIVIEAFLIVAISAYSEIKITQFGGGNASYSLSIFSFAFSIIIVVVLHLTILLNVYELWKLRDTLIIEYDSYFTEFFSGLKEDNLSRTFNIGNMIRRSLLALWVVVFTFLPDIAVIIIFILLQLMFTVYIIYLRPFILKRDNLRECINEIMFFSFSSTHIYLNSESTWNDTYAWIYIGVVMGNIMAASMISFSGGIIDLIKKIGKNRSKGKNPSMNSNKIHIDNTQTNLPSNPSNLSARFNRSKAYTTSRALSGINLVPRTFIEESKQPAFH
jgi:hypothetical protein